MATLQQQNAKMRAEMQQMRYEMQQRSAWAANYGYGPAPPLGDWELLEGVPNICALLRDVRSQVCDYISIL